ncbi:MAG: MnmC family methyltransferase [Candidatus Gastranaerophilales bacterium]|nr:MnmC family methyltransferase [Candidatus Gastranaerophilales bacterium]
MNNFDLIKTADGSMGLYSNQVNDIYHDKSGAKKEALEKFILPSGILNFVKKNNQVNILDICFGLGYNSKCAIEEIKKINPNCKIYITCLENDINILALSCILQMNMQEITTESAFMDLFLTYPPIKALVRKYLSDKSLSQYLAFKKEDYLKEFLNYGGIFNHSNDLIAFLHNIYYRTISKRKIKQLKLPYNKKNIAIKLTIGDARDTIIEENGKFDYIFHDGFTPSKTPCLWSLEFLSILSNLISDEGVFVTYTCSSPVRSALKEVGFNLGKTLNLKNKPIGTVASKNEFNIKNKLNDKELTLLQTNAGIFYRDEKLKLTNSEILQNRELEIKKSTRLSTSRFFKNLII